MATAQRMKQLESNMVSVKQINDAKEEAQRLHRQAFGAQPVKQTDGTVLELCWSARLDRAYTLRSEARRQKNEMRGIALDRAIAQLSDSAQRAGADAQRAIDDYVGLCARIGQVADTDAFAVDCGCLGCIEGQRRRAMWEAERVMRTQFTALFVPALSDASNMPPVVALLIGCDSAPLQALGAAMQVFVERSREAGLPVVWADSLDLTW